MSDLIEKRPGAMDGLQGFEKFCCRVFSLLALIMFAVLFWYGLHLTGQNGGDSEYISFREDSAVYNVLTLGAALICLCLVSKLGEKMQGRKARNIALAAVCTVTAAVSFYWVYVCKAAPQADQMMICQYADAFNMGDFNGVLQGRYIARYPQQLGMVTLLRGLFSIFGPYHYQAFQYLMVAVVPLIVVSGCMIVRLLSEDNARAEIFYLLFMLTCFPMYIYTVFVYGDLISTALGMFGVWMYLAYLKKFSWIRLLLFGLSMGFAVQLRANLMILVVAMAIVLLIKLIVQWKWQNIVIAAALVLGVVLANMAVWGFYSDKVEEKAPSIPPLLFIVMGLNDADGHPGWYNAYNYIVFAGHNDDVEVSNSIAMEHLKEAFQRYWEDPDYMLDFFQRKMNAQWNAPMYQSIAMNRYIEGDQIGKLAPDITNYGRSAQLMESWMKIYQLLMYGGLLFLLAAGRKKFLKIEKYALLIAVYGGFLFSLIWEAKTRYVLPFLFFQIPYMALAISELTVAIRKLPGNLRRAGLPRRVLANAGAGVVRLRQTLGKNRIFVGGCVAVLALHMALILFFGAQKKGFLEEEYDSYYSSTGTIHMEQYSPVMEKSGYGVQFQYLVIDGNEFNYEVVADAQKPKNRPPLYYLALNTLMSLRPNSFYKWFGIGLNAVCSLISCCGIMTLAFMLDRGKYRRMWAILAGLAFGVCPVSLSNVMFTGPHAMNVMWVILYLDILIAMAQEPRCHRRKYIGLTAAGGAVCGLAFLTSYISLIPVLALWLGGCVRAAVRRQGLGRMLRFAGVMAICVMLAILAFPFSIRHVFMLSGRGTGEIYYTLGAVLIPVAACLICKGGLRAWEKRTGGLDEKNYWQAAVLAAGVVLLCGGVGMAVGGVHFLQREGADKIAFSRSNAQYPAVVVCGYASPKQAWYASDELWPYERIVYVDYLDGDCELKNETLINAERLIVYMDCPEEILDRLIAQNDGLDSYSLVRREEKFCVYEVQ